jgi:hypothetical protein
MIVFSTLDPNMGRVQISRPGDAWLRRRATFGEVTLRFGKHCGKPLAQIPADYLIWVLRNCSRLNPYTREAIEGFLRT